MQKNVLHEMHVKKKQRIKALCYVGLVVMTILLFLPPVLRIFVKDKTQEEEKKKDVVTSLNCNKVDESITATFLNEKPQNLMYQIKGNYNVIINQNNADELVNDEISNPDEIILQDNVTNNASTSNSLIDIVAKHGKFNYDESKNLSILRVSFSVLQNEEIYQKYLTTLQKQEEYYSALGFSCTKITV